MFNSLSGHGCITVQPLPPSSTLCSEKNSLMFSSIISSQEPICTKKSVFLDERMLIINAETVYLFVNHFCY